MQDLDQQKVIRKKTGVKSNRVNAALPVNSFFNSLVYFLDGLPGATLSTAPQ